jgi:phosphate transport system substrate-binding protein
MNRAVATAGCWHPTARERQRGHGLAHVARYHRGNSRNIAPDSRMTAIRRCLPALATLLLVATSAVAQNAGRPTLNHTWYGDLASARAYMGDTAKLYEARHRGQKVEVKAISTVAALDMLAQGRVDVVGSARLADPDNAFEQKLVFTPVVWDAIVLVTSPKNPVSALSLEQIADVYLGRIKDWSELGGNPGAINLYAVAGPDDGVEFSLRRALLGNGNRIVAAKRWYINTKQLEDGIAIDPAALGVTTLSALSRNKLLKPLAVEGTMPSFATLESGEYLFATPLYLVTRGPGSPQGDSGARAQDALEFMNSESALRAAWRSRQLVPAVDADQLVEADAKHSALIAERLAFAVAAVPVNVVPAAQVAFQDALIAPLGGEAAPASVAPLPATEAVAAPGKRCKTGTNC